MEYRWKWLIFAKCKSCEAELIGQLTALLEIINKIEGKDC
jgi:hypothetical protein